MNAEHIADVLLEIKSQVGSLDTKLIIISDTLLKHEHRLTELEHRNAERGSDVNGRSQTSLKDDLLRLLAKCLLVSLTGIASLVGASSLLTQIIRF